MSSIVSAKVFALFILFFVSIGFAHAQGSSLFTLPAGTRITLKLRDAVNSRFSDVDDTFRGTVSKPVELNDSVVLPAETVFEGRVTIASPARFGGRSGKLDLLIDRLWFDTGESRRIEAVLVDELEPPSDGTEKAVAIGGGLAAGTLIGAASGRSRGAVIGAAVGTGIGTGIALLKKGRNVGISADQEFEIVLKKDVVLPVRAF